MAKEIFPPDPVPVLSIDSSIDDDLFCASFLEYSKKSFSKTSTELFEYLDSNYESTYLGGSSVIFIIENKNVKDVENEILNLNISGITKKTINMHVMLSENDNKTEAILVLY